MNAPSKLSNLLTFRNCGIAILVLIIDYLGYAFFGLLLMNYDDFYQPSDGPYWSWQSMDSRDRVYYVMFESWNVINLIFIGFLAYRLWKYLRS
jgi:hypothetical protein